MTEQEFYRQILSVNYANLMANLENLSINQEILKRSQKTDAQIIYLLQQIFNKLSK